MLIHDLYCILQAVWCAVIKPEAVGIIPAGIGYREPLQSLCPEKTLGIGLRLHQQAVETLFPRGRSGGSQQAGTRATALLLRVDIKTVQQQPAQTLGTITRRGGLPCGDADHTGGAVFGKHDVQMTQIMPGVAISGQRQTLHPLRQVPVLAAMPASLPSAGWMWPPRGC